MVIIIDIVKVVNVLILIVLWVLNYDLNLFVIEEIKWKIFEVVEILNYMKYKIKNKNK